MPRNSSGLYQKPAGTTAVADTTIESAKFNTLMDDLASEMTASLARDGRTVLTGDLNFNGNDIVAAGTVGAATVTSTAYGFPSDAGTGVAYISDDRFALQTGGSNRLVVTAGSSEAVVSVIGQFSVPLGSASAPSYTFTGDIDTGMFSPGANAIGFATSTLERFRITADAVSVQALGVLGISDGAVGSPGLTFTSDSDTGIYRSAANTLNLVTSGASRMVWSASDVLVAAPLRIPTGSAGAPAVTPFNDTGSGLFTAGANTLSIAAGGAERLRVTNGSAQPVIDAYGYMRVTGSGSGSGSTAFYVQNSAANGLFVVRDDSLITAPGVYNFTIASGANVYVDGSGGLYRAVSSRRYKEDIQDYARGLDALALLRPVSFRSKTGGSERYAGFIAEEVHEAGLTEFVDYNAEGEPEALHYPHMVTILTKALQEAAAKIEALAARIEALEAAP